MKKTIEKALLKFLIENNYPDPKRRDAAIKRIMVDVVKVK